MTIALHFVVMQRDYSDNIIMKKYLAELLGTFTLALVVILSSSGLFPVPTALLAAFTLLLFVYTIGPLSGSHINPAVTVGLLALRKIEQKDAAFYIIFQLLGAWLAMMLALRLGMSAVPAPSETVSVAFAEGLGMFFFAFGIASVATGRVSSSLSGMVVGGSLLLGAAIAALSGSMGILNPAVALGLHSFYPVYILGPVSGSILGMLFYQYLSEEKKKAKKTK